LINVVAARSFRGLADTIEVRPVSGRNFGPVPKRNRPAVNGRRKAANSLNRWLRARRYVFHPDEVAEAEAQGLPYLLVPRVCSSGREWMERWSGMRVGGPALRGACGNPGTSFLRSGWPTIILGAALHEHRDKMPGICPRMRASRQAGRRSTTARAAPQSLSHLDRARYRGTLQLRRKSAEQSRTSHVGGPAVRGNVSCYPAQENGSALPSRRRACGTEIL
jgi:hypothetical protein